MTQIYPSKDDLAWTGVPGGDRVLAYLALVRAAGRGPSRTGHGVGEDIELDVLIG